jgi:zinc protease
VTPDERDRTIRGKIRELPGSFESANEVLGGMQRNYFARRPDNYYDSLADRYRAMTAADLDTVARAVIRPDDLLWVVVGDAAKVMPQLQKLGLPIEKRTVGGGQ